MTDEQIEQAITEMFNSGLTVHETRLTELPPELDTWVTINGRKFVIHLDRRAIKALISTAVREARLRGVEEVLLKLKQAPPIDWIDAQSWIDGEYARLQAQLKEEK